MFVVAEWKIGEETRHPGASSSLGNGVEGKGGIEAWKQRLFDLRNEQHEVVEIRGTCDTLQRSDDRFHDVEDDRAAAGKLRRVERILFAAR